MSSRLLELLVIRLSRNFQRLKIFLAVSFDRCVRLQFENELQMLFNNSKFVVVVTKIEITSWFVFQHLFESMQMACNSRHPVLKSSKNLNSTQFYLMITLTERVIVITVRASQILLQFNWMLKDCKCWFKCKMSFENDSFCYEASAWRILCKCSLVSECIAY